MFIITDKENVVFHISETINYQKNGNVLVDNDSLAIAKYLVKKVYKVSEIPENIEISKYCYTEEKGFYINENYREPEPTPEEKIDKVLQENKDLQEQITNLELALAEMYENGGIE